MRGHLRLKGKISMFEADLAIVGSGPAGMAAANEAALHGMHVLLVDEQTRVGGQIYRDIERVAPLRGDILGPDYLAGLPLLSGLKHDNITHISGATIWQVDVDGQLTFSRDGEAHQIRAKRILLATGALERPLPIPGWTLPGVMTVGAGQILLKQSGLIATDAVLVGTGPLLYVLASQMVKAGKAPLALVETQSRSDFFASMTHFAGALRGWRYLLKGLKLLATLKKAGVKRYTAARNLSIKGDDAASALQFETSNGTQILPCQTIFLHHGVTPNIQISQSLGLEHSWDEKQFSFSPNLDEWGQSSSETVFIAGDGAGIGGAKVAELSGRLAALQVASALGFLSEPERDLIAAPMKTEKQQELAARPFLDRAYPPYAEALRPDDDTIICRCEEITAGSIRKLAELGAPGPNQVKTQSRSGMGPCQGRNCGLSVSMLISQTTGKTMDEIGYFRIRTPLKPVTLGELASLHEGTVEGPKAIGGSK